MTSFKKTIAAFCLGLTAMSCVSVVASEAKTILVNVNKNDDQAATVDLKIDGDAQAFTLPDLQVGESKTFNTNSGKSVVATRTESGYNISVEGKEIKIPAFDGKLGARLHKSTPLHYKKENTINVSGIELNDTQKQIIRDAFIAAGIDKEVSFSSHKMIFLSADDLNLNGNHNAFEFITEGGNIDVKMNGDGNTEIHKVITIDVSEDKKD